MKTLLLLSSLLSFSAFGSDCSLLHPIPVIEILGCPSTLTLHHVVLSEKPIFLHPEHYVPATDLLALDLTNIVLNGRCTGFLGATVRVENKADWLGFQKTYSGSPDLIGDSTESFHGTTFYETKYAVESARTYVSVSVQDEQIVSILLQHPIYKVGKGGEPVFTGEHQWLCVMDADLNAPVTTPASIQ